MDDFYCMHESKQYLKECLKQIELLVEKYQLKLNTKTKIYSSTENVEFLGFVFSCQNRDIRMKLTNKTKRNFKRKMKKKRKELEWGEIPANDYLQIRNSYRGHLSYGDCHGLYNDYAISDEEMKSIV